MLWVLISKLYLKSKYILKIKKKMIILIYIFSKGRTELSMNCDILELSFMGSGYSLFLQYIKYAIFIIFIYV